MFKNFTVVAVAALIASGPAFAADLPSRSAPVAPVAPAFTWTGFYLGANVGAGFGGDFRLRDTVAALPVEAKLSAGGFIAGGQAGFNYQMGSFVVGIEGDLAYADLKNSVTASAAGHATATAKMSTDYLATVRGRIGYAWDRVLVYATGGVAFTKIELSAHAVAGGVAAAASHSKTHTGWALGAGVEAALTDNISAKAEYLYVDFDKKRYFPSGIHSGLRGDLNSHIIRVGVNYRFGL